MKTLTFLIAILNATIGTFAQNAKYVSAMEKNIDMMDTARHPIQLQGLANAFERLANVEKKEWLPNYYAAHCYASLAYNSKGDAIDEYCDKADVFIKKADSLSPDNSEIYAVMAEIASARISVNPMSRGQKYGSLSAELRKKAMALDPANPRPWLLEGQGKFFTPAVFGGGKNKAKPAFEKSLELFQTHKPASKIHPGWGKNAATYFLKKCNE